MATFTLEADHVHGTWTDALLRLGLASGGQWPPVFSATAYHWISPQAQADPAEMLKPGGLIGVVDLNQVTSPNNDVFGAAQPIYDKYGTDTPRFHHHRPATA